MSDNLISGTASGDEFSDDTVPYVGPVAIIKGRSINKSPVLYLRRRRNTGYMRYRDSGPFSTWGGASSKHSFGSPLSHITSDNLVPVDDGEIYPNHFGEGRLGSVEWIKFRDYKRKWPKWIRSVQLVIDGADT